MNKTPRLEDFYSTLVVDGMPKDIEFRVRRIGGPYEVEYTPKTPIYWDPSTRSWSENPTVLSDGPRRSTGMLGKSDLLGSEDFPTGMLGKSDLLGSEDFPKFD